MKNCKGMYSLDGFTISYSQEIQKWVAQPNFLTGEFGSHEKVFKFQKEHQHDILPQLTLNEIKRQVKIEILNGIKLKLIQEYTDLNNM